LLSVLIGEQPEILKQILEFYLPKGSSILDITYGHGKLYQASGYVNFDEYTIIGNDIDPDSPAKHHLPFDDLPSLVDEYGKFDCVIYDPPYKYNEPSFILFKRPDYDWSSNKTKWSINDQMESAKILNKILPMVLNPNGLLIVKIMDTRYKGELILNHSIIIDAFKNFELIDVIVYIRTLVGVFRNNRHSQTAHGYYLIFKRNSYAKACPNPTEFNEFY